MPEHERYRERCIDQVSNDVAATSGPVIDLKEVVRGQVDGGALQRDAAFQLYERDGTRLIIEWEVALLMSYAINCMEAVQ